MSAPTSTTVYFITGANRGIGLGLAQRSLAARPNSLVYAGARQPSKADKLQAAAQQHSNLHMVQLDVGSDADHTAAAKRVEQEAGRVDVVLANAGIAAADAYQQTGQQSLDLLREHFEVNTVGPVRLFNAFLPLLQRSADPKYVVVSSLVGSIASQSYFPTLHVANYGSSKAAINFITQRIHLEHPQLTAFPLSPGWVQTDMGNAGAKVGGMEEAPVTLEQSVSCIVKLVDAAKRDTHGGRLWDVMEGKVVSW